MPKIALNFKIIDFVVKCIFRYKEKIFKYPTNKTTDIIFENINIVAGDGIPQSIHAVDANTDGVNSITAKKKSFNI